MKIAIIGTGVSGLVSAHMLKDLHDITVFEEQDRIGGHVHTVDVEQDGITYAVDTGFIVYNDWTYPNFIRLLEALGVETQESRMSFGVRCDRTGLEYCGSTPNTLFAQRSNLLNLAFLGMLRDIVRFNMRARSHLSGNAVGATMAEFLTTNRFGPALIEQYLLPMMAAIWSTDPFRARDFPASHFLRFFENHGLLNLVNRPVWRVIRRGSRSYVNKLIEPIRDRIRTGAGVRSVKRTHAGIEVRSRHADPELYDRVIIASHSDEALAMLADPSERERSILGSISYQPNHVLLHTDTSILPRNRRAWASWNYYIPPERETRVCVTYNMNILQGLSSPNPFLVTLNSPAGIRPDSVLGSYTYHHPVYSPEAVAAQKRHSEINGVNGIHYCGAYWGYGFHEDGVKSAIAACEPLGGRL